MAEEKSLAEQQVTAEEQVVPEEQPLVEQQVKGETQVAPAGQSVATETTADEQPITITAETTAAEEQPLTEEKSQPAQENRVSFFQLCSQLNAPWWSGIQRIAAWYINISEQLTRRALDLQEQATGWAKDTPWAPLFQSQHSLASQWIDGSVALARSLWRLEPAEKARKKATGEAERR